MHRPGSIRFEIFLTPPPSLHLGDMPHLFSFAIRHNAHSIQTSTLTKLPPPIPQLLASSLCLHHLRVAACSLGDNSAVSIGKALAQNKTLKTLDLSCNTISDIGAEEIGAALKKNTSLKGLLLWNNRVYHTGAEALASGLASNHTLQWLGVRGIILYLF